MFHSSLIKPPFERKITRSGYVTRSWWTHKKHQSEYKTRNYTPGSHSNANKGKRKKKRVPAPPKSKTGRLMQLAN